MNALTEIDIAPTATAALHVTTCETVPLVSVSVELAGKVPWAAVIAFTCSCGPSAPPYDWPAVSPDESVVYAGSVKETKSAVKAPATGMLTVSVAGLVDAAAV